MSAVLFEEDELTLVEALSFSCFASVLHAVRKRWVNFNLADASLCECCEL